MRGLKHLIPDNVRDSLNSNPIFQWAVIALFLALGVFFVYKGARGVIDKRITDKRGRVYEGVSAQILGVIYAVLGAAMVVLPLLFKLAGA
jgi:multisubunit Na+/H+ antiporter MnhG subunit